MWQQEIIEKLQNFHNEIQTFTITHLLEKYNHLNEEILTIYQQLRAHSSNDYLIGKIQELKQQRISLGSQIQLAKNHSLLIM
ncbi:hypothetical protein [Peribacillus loiseleuriae]|uniref:hypothetical protein n=1 Tax=Peribacillus loiseleuriae TaxID=1679170 RepID=UPI003CFD5BDB